MYRQDNTKKNSTAKSLPLVLEIGEFSTKVGWAGEDKPSFITPTVFLIDKDFRV